MRAPSAALFLLWALVAAAAPTAQAAEAECPEADPADPGSVCATWSSTECGGPTRVVLAEGMLDQRVNCGEGCSGHALLLIVIIENGHEECRSDEGGTACANDVQIIIIVGTDNEACTSHGVEDNVPVWPGD